MSYELPMTPNQKRTMAAILALILGTGAAGAVALGLGALRLIAALSVQLGAIE